MLNFNRGLAKPPLQLEYGRLVIKYPGEGMLKYIDGLVQLAINSITNKLKNPSC